MPTTELATLPDWLQVHRRERPDAVAISGDGADVSYAELADDVARLAAGLAASGIGKDDVVAAQLPNGRAFVTAFLATAALGAVFQTLHMPYRSKELRYLIGHAGAKAVFALAHAGGASPASDILALKAELPTLEHVIGVGGTVDGTLSYAALLRSEPSGSTSAASPDDTYLLLYTSGTTAEPKGVPHSARAFLGNAFR
ncbi:MAG: AMP-binding protein, partial [Nitratireductor sp.]